MGKVVKAVVFVAAAVALVAFAAPLAGALAGALSITATATIAAITTTIVGIGISLGLTAVMGLFRKVPSMSNATVDRLVSSTVPSAPRKIVFGETAAGNDIRFSETSGSKKDRLDIVIALASHRINAVKALHFENDLAWSGSVTSKFSKGLVAVRSVLEGSSANAFVIATGSYWNTSSKFTGCAYTSLRYKLDGELWPDGIPSRITTIVEGCPLYDPRRDSSNGGSGSHRIADQSTWKYWEGWTAIGRNPALALLTYLLGYRINGKLVWGMGIPASRIDFGSFRAYANLCEETVAAQGGYSVQRYTCDGILSCADSHETCINAITAAMGSCKLIDAGGLYSIIGGFDDTLGLKVGFSEDDLVAPAGGTSSYSWVPAPPVRETFNIVKGRFANPASLYQLEDWGTIETDALYDGIPRTMSLDLGMVSRAETCQRIAKQFLLREAKTPGVFSGVFGPRAFAAQVGSLVTLSLGAQGWNKKLFRVLEQAESHDLIFQMTLREESSEVYAWDKEEKPLPATIRPAGYDPTDVLPVEGLAASTTTSVGASSYETSDVTVTWTPQDSGRVQSIQIDARPVGVLMWSEVAANGRADLGTMIFQSVRPGAQIEIRARYRMTTGVYGPWANVTIDSAPAKVDWKDAVYGDDKPEDNATVGAPDGTWIGSGEKAVLAEDLVKQVDAIAAGGFGDTTPPPVPGNLTLTSELTDAGATLRASWGESAADDLAGYEIAVSEGAGALYTYQTSERVWERAAIKRNTEYRAKVRSYDKAGNKSAYTTVISHMTGRDTVAPALATGLTANGTYEAITLNWTNPADLDLVSTEVWTNTTNSTASARKLVTLSVRPSSTSSHRQTITDPTVPNYYWLKTIDSSGNASAFTSGVGPIKTALVDITGVAPAVAQGIIRTVTTLPPETGYTGATVVFNSADGKLYRYVAGKWTKEVSTDDFDNLITEDLIDTRGLDIRAPDGVTMFGSDGRISDRVIVATPGGGEVSLTTVVANALTPSLHYVGEFASPPTQAQLGADWKQNAVYKNALDGRSYVLTGDPLDWQIYLVDGQSFTVAIESSNGNTFRVGQATTTLLTARVFKNGAEITSSIPETWIKWRRVSGRPRPAPYDDATFNAKYATGYKSISINIDDIQARATFFVDVTN